MTPDGDWMGSVLLTVAVAATVVACAVALAFVVMMLWS